MEKLQCLDHECLSPTSGLQVEVRLRKINRDQNDRHQLDRMKKLTELKL